MWRALRDPTRRRILDVLRQGPENTTELCDAIPETTRHGVVKHLKALESAQLIRVEARGRERLNHLNATPLHEIYVVIDYRVQYVSANGLRRPKVFKLTQRRLVPGQPATVTRQHRFEHVSIRRIRPGRPTLDVQVNGHIPGTIDLDVIDPTPSR